MLYRLIAKAKERWLHSSDCAVRSMIDYMVEQGRLRDAQLDSITTYLYLKLACDNQPLYKLMIDGAFNSIGEEQLGEMALKSSSREFLRHHKDAIALYEYAASSDEKGGCTSAELAALILEDPSSLDYEAIIRQMFYNVSYADYLFSIPMGAGKTWLMAAFVYLNLYFASTNPENELFAHNFLVLVPANLKNSIIPSLKDIKEFDPTILFPEQTAMRLRALIKYEFLEADNSLKDSNKVRNPNALKIQLYQPFDTLMGLVAVTNVEKLYDHFSQTEDNMPSLVDLLPEKEKSEWMRRKLANELREIISRLPRLCIMIDEVHHAADEDILLRKVVEKWARSGNFNSVIGFSGTPYMSKPERIRIDNSLTVKTSMMSNVVTYYPLVRAVGNFLKKPIIKSSDESTELIVRNGLTDFFDRYIHTSYPDVGMAKVAVYCGRINTLETIVRPIAASVCRDYGLNPDEAVLTYFRNNKEGFRCPDNAESRFRALDTPLSSARVILLAQIGKEGWNCKSLTSVILPTEGSSPKNMVLQTSCRCMREVRDAGSETALIWLNNYNRNKLNEQLKKEHHTSVDEIQHSRGRKQHGARRYSRQNVVNLPQLSYLQLHVSYNIHTGDGNDIPARLAGIDVSEKGTPEVLQQDIAGNEFVAGLLERFDRPGPACFNQWLALIRKESFNTISLDELFEHTDILKNLFERATEVDEAGQRYYTASLNQDKLRADIRRCFSSLVSIRCNEELIPREASLLNVSQIESKPFFSAERTILYPDNEAVIRILNEDSPRIPDHIRAAVELLESEGARPEAVDILLAPYCSQKADAADKRTYQYIPYAFDSEFEKSFYSRVLYPLLNNYRNLEIYYSGDESLSEFYICCFSKENGRWKNIGRYYPDFLLLRREAEGKIAKVVVVETKGTAFAAMFKPKKDFMEKFMSINNQFGKTKFDFLYLEDSLPESQQLASIKKHIEEFLNI